MALVKTLHVVLLPLSAALAGCSLPPATQVMDNIHYQEFVPPAGVGPPVLVLSGASGPPPVEYIAKDLATNGYDVLLCAGKDFRPASGGNDSLRKMISVLQASPHARAEKVAVIGLSLGGTSAIQYASTDPDLVAVSLAYYPATSGPWLHDQAEVVRQWKVPTIVFAGEADTGPITMGYRCCMADTIRAMAATAKDIGAPFELHVYPGAEHDFVWLSSANYNRAAAEDSWRRTLAALRQYLA
jgi:dienelactone hydrolase